MTSCGASPYRLPTTSAIHIPVEDRWAPSFTSQWRTGEHHKLFGQFFLVKKNGTHFQYIIVLSITNNFASLSSIIIVEYSKDATQFFFRLKATSQCFSYTFAFSSRRKFLASVCQRYPPFSITGFRLPHSVSGRILDRKNFSGLSVRIYWAVGIPTTVKLAHKKICWGCHTFTFTWRWERCSRWLLFSITPAFPT